MLVPWFAVGGADKFSLDLLMQLTNRGWQVYVIATLPSDHPWLSRFTAFAQEVLLLPECCSIGTYPQFLRDTIQARCIDIVLIANSELGYLLLPYLRAECPDVTFVDYCHMEEQAWKRGGYPRMSIEQRALLDLQIVSSDYLRGWMIDGGAEEQRVRVCYTNIDPDTWQPDSERRTRVRQEFQDVYGLAKTTPMILYAGRICNQKQPHVFAETIRLLRQKTHHFLAIVAGEGPELVQLQASVSRHGLQAHVRFLGAVSNERMRDLMIAADIFFLSSEWEGIALSVFEAMACGLPVVGADVGGQSELVTPACGILIPRSDMQTEALQYTDILASLLADASRRTALGKAGAQRIRQHFQLEQMGDRMVSLLQEACRLHTDLPRPVPDAAWGKAKADRAILYLRIQAVARQFLSPTLRAFLDKRRKWLLPLKERLEQVLVG